MCENSKKFGKKAVLVAVAAILGVSILAAPVSAGIHVDGGESSPGYGGIEISNDECWGVYDDIDLPGRFGHTRSQETDKDKYSGFYGDPGTPKRSTQSRYTQKETTQTKKPTPETIKKSSSQPAQVVKYGDMIATKNGVDVTDAAFSKPVYVYIHPNIGYFTHSSSTPSERCLDINIVMGSKIPYETYDEALEAFNSLTERTHYKTYGEVCEALDELNAKICKEAGQKYDLGGFKYDSGTGFYFYETTSNFVLENVVFCHTQTKKEPTTIEGQTNTETIYKPTNYDLDDLDENMCSPREYAYIAKTRNGTMYISCRCKPGYTRVRGGCTFDLPIADVLYVEELERLERVYRALGANEGTAMNITKDGETIKLGVLRRSDYSLLYTLDGETWDSDIAKIVNPSIIDRIGTLWDNIGDAINPVNWFEASYKDKDKQMQYEIAGDTLELYQEDTKKISQYAYEYYSDAKDKKGAIETLLEGDLIKGSAEMAEIETDLLKYTMTFPGVAFTKFVDEAQIQQIANGFFVYAEMRENKTWMSPQEIVNDEKAIGYSSWGLDESLGEIILCQLYEESYQRYLLRKTLQAK